MKNVLMGWAFDLTVSIAAVCIGLTILSFAGPHWTWAIAYLTGCVVGAIISCRRMSGNHNCA